MMILRRFALLSLVLAMFATAARSDNPPTEKDIKDIEQKIEELQKKKAELEAAKKSVSPAASEAGMPAGASIQFNWRLIGPANMGGRITALAIYDADPTTYYVATASGGLIKTVNNGITFDHQFDQQSTVSIGDVAVCQSNPNLVWVGTGEANPRNSVSYGDGVYKSTDGGKTYTNMGLKGTFQIGKILIHPKNPDTVYVGAMGRLYGPNKDRGLYKTTDGGKTWNSVLFVDDNTGVIDARLDPHDPETIIVGLWERKRDSFDGFFGDPPVPDIYGPIVTHGAGGGLRKSTDGGKTWTKLTKGLPTAKTGRIGLDYSSKTKGLIYAIVDSEKVGTGDPLKNPYFGIIGESAENNTGAKLTEITKNGPADKAGLKVGDIVTKAGDLTIKEYDDLLDFIKTQAPEAKVVLTVVRDGKTESITVIVGKRPEQGDFPGRGNRGPRAVAGFTLGSTTEGAKINSLLPNSPAEKAGLKVDDVIIKTEGKMVKSVEDYTSIIGTDRKPGDKIKMTVKRDGKSFDYEITLSLSETAPPTEMLMPGFVPDVNTFGERAVKVAEVAKGSEAEKKGAKVGDLILECDGKPVTSLFNFIGSLRTSSREDNPRKAGDMLKVKLLRDEKEIELLLPLAMMPVSIARGGPNRGATPGKPYQLGLGGQQANVQDQQGKDGWNTGGVYMSKDNGDTWTRVNSLNTRPMYFSVVRVDPTDDMNIYVLGDVPVLWKSTNGGKTFKEVRTAGGVHADAHAFWINPRNGKHMVIGVDGGVYITYDGGLKWDHLNHLALGQFYHVAADNRRPYRVYGGLQDNGSWGGPSNSLRSYGPVNEDWIFVSGGDGFVCRIDPNDPDLVYSESQGGAMSRRNFRTGERGFIRPSLKQNETPHRFNWNTPFILSNHNPSIFYCAGEYVWKSVKKGAELKKISPEITRTKQGSATAICESPMNADVVWAGTDDGYIWVTQDGGTTWKNVTDAIITAGLPSYRWVSTIEASRERDGRCYVCLDAHRSDDDRPYLFATEDFGRTWKAITSNLPTFGSTRCLREDMVNRDLLYCGTEFGAFVSANRGESWTKLGGNLPTVAVHEIAQTPSASEIVAATHGRSIWVLDVATLRQLKPKTLTDAVTLMAPPAAIRWRTGVGGESPYSSTDRKFVGTNPSRGVSLDYVLKAPAKEVSLKVLDINGKTVRAFTSPKKTAGLHRVNWDMNRGATSAVRGPGGAGGGAVSPGIYRVVLIVDGVEFSQPVQVEIDPNAPKDLIVIDELEWETEPVNPLKPVKVRPWDDR
jgi:S1-C subfamily serine protease/photosystem II stability/assembly factor-like uncharacterized protein